MAGFADDRRQQPHRWVARLERITNTSIARVVVIVILEEVRRRRGWSSLQAERAQLWQERGAKQGGLRAGAQRECEFAQTGAVEQREDVMLRERILLRELSDGVT